MMKFVKHGLLSSRLASITRSGDIGKNNFVPRMNNNNTMKHRPDKARSFLWAIFAPYVTPVGTVVGWQYSMPFF